MPSACQRETLSELYRTQPGLVVVDSLHIQAQQKPTLPNASWLHGAGWSQTGKDSMIDSNFSKAMSAIAPYKTTPIVAYCLDIRCWLSWNTAFRLVQIGYTEVYWYRGGMASWKAADLPLVLTPITAQLW